ncbi:MAG TPA: hypothetical protein VIL51_05205 [Thermoleophilia bacterium]
MVEVVGECNDVVVLADAPKGLVDAVDELAPRDETAPGDETAPDDEDCVVWESTPEAGVVLPVAPAAFSADA